MIERLQRVLTRIGQLPPELQEEVAAQLEVLTEPLEAMPNLAQEKSKSLAGAWRDLEWDNEAEAFDRMRHATQPTPPIEL